MVTTSSSSSTNSVVKTSSLVTALGGGSGIDMAALANNLATATFEARTAQLNSKSEQLATKVSTASNIRSMLLSLDTSLGNLVRTGSLSPAPSVANSSVATATLSGSSQPKGTFSLEVTKLASAQRVASNAYPAATSTVGAGTLTLRFGTVSGSSFTENTSRPAVDITVAPGATLNDVALAINAKNSGVTAYVANTASGAQLVMRGADGAESGFVLDAAEDPANPGLSNLAWTPGGSNGQLLASAQDAAFTIDGLQYTSKTNTATDAIPGVKLQLTSTNVGAPTTVSVSDPTSEIASSMQDFTDALNEVMSALNAATGIGGDLATDSGVRTLKRSLMGLASSVVMPSATGAARTLADLGLSTQRDGSFTLDTARLSSTIAKDPDGVAAMFTNGVNGVYATYNKIYRAAVSSTNSGSLAGSITKYNKEITKISDNIADFAEQQEALRARLASQFTASETRIGILKSTQSMLENQIAAWNKSGS
jgi:Flagellar capping protein